jgi:hypothetical protein
MTGRDEGDGGIAQSVQEIHNLLARDAKDILHAFPFQTAHH